MTEDEYDFKFKSPQYNDRRNKYIKIYYYKRSRWVVVGLFLFFVLFFFVVVVFCLFYFYFLFCWCIFF